MAQAHSHRLIAPFEEGGLGNLLLPFAVLRTANVPGLPLPEGGNRGREAQDFAHR
jgi:hypothetical protein